jgi:hypothetical protein
VIEGANARHEHEWVVWQDSTLPDGKILIPGVVTHSTDIVEHPELVSQRIQRYAQVVGRENVIAGCDCGFGGRCHPQIAWAKLRSLVEGAARASRALHSTQISPRLQSLRTVSRPTSFDSSAVRDWQVNHDAFWAWEKIWDMPAPERWRMVQVMVAYAPDRDVLATVAAGPVEDSFGLTELMRDEAEKNARFRICLGMAYGLPSELQPFVDHRKESEPLPPGNPVDATPEEINVMTAYFHHSDTMWAPAYFEDLNQRQPEEALFFLRLLLASREYPQVRTDVFSDAFARFVRHNFASHRTELRELLLEHEDLRHWCMNKKYPPIKAVEGWDAFVQDLTNSGS